jgi:H3 lysine-79-specific histone-lysine N-methyltransferase
MFTFGAKPNPKIVVPKREVRVEKAAPVKKPNPLPSKLAANPTQQSREPLRSQYSKERARPATPDRLHPKSQKRKALRQKSPVHQRFESSSEDEADSPAPSYTFPEKRQKSGTPADLKRQLRAERVFSVEDGENLVHAADVANENPGAILLELQYPAAKQRERCVILVHIF